jgi:acyl-[acyl-carrier-protein]-phospholipid O-acyltransferase / long-chain-fatty-acid--[acyl-carrier-protein] ligase
MNTTKALSSKEFKSLMGTLFLGALNDNLFKTIVSLLVLSRYVNEADGTLFLSLTAGLFALPYILFSGIAGFLSDTFSKTKIIRYLKLFEFLIMILAFFSFINENPFGLLASVFLMGLQSALFSPAKYGILPEMLSKEDLSKGNGYTEFFTFLAIIAGTACAGLVLSIELANPGIVSLGVAILGVLFSLGVGSHVPSLVQGNSFSINPFGPNVARLKEISKDRGLYLCVIGSAFFFFVGTLFQLNILVFAKQTLEVSEVLTSVLLASLAIGIGTGSIIAGKTSEGKVEIGLIPLGGLGLCILSLLISLTSFSYSISLFLVFFLGMSGGLFIVPINAYLQANSPRDKLGSYLAASNFLTFVGIVVSSFLYWILADLAHASPSMIFLLMGICSLFVAIYLIKLLPEMMARCLNWILLHIFYRIKKIDTHHIPKTGGALIVSNHVSFIDAQLILAATERPVRFIMFRAIYENPLIKPIAKINKAIPISGSDGKEEIEKTLKFAADLIAQGELVGIFAEGKITRTGELNEFRPGMETIMSHVNAPIIPVCLKGVWGSIFSFERGKVFLKLPKKIPYPLSVRFCAPLPASTNAKMVEEIIAAFYKEENTK